MKGRIVFLVVILVGVVFQCSVNSVLALGLNDAAAQVYSPDIAQAGAPLTVSRILFQSNSSDTLTITNVGIQYDWMDSDAFWGFTLATPITVQPGGTHLFGEITIQIPATVSAGTHTYYVGIDGMQGASTPFSWDSSQQTIEILGNTNVNQTAAPTSNSDRTNGPVNYLEITVAIAVAAIVLVLVVIGVTMRIRNKKPKSKPQAAVADQPAEQNAEEKPKTPEEKPAPASSEGEPGSTDYSI